MSTTDDQPHAEAAQKPTAPTPVAGLGGLAEAERRYGKRTPAEPTEETPAPSRRTKGRAEAVRRFGNRATGGSAA